MRNHKYVTLFQPNSVRYVLLKNCLHVVKFLYILWGNMFLRDILTVTIKNNAILTPLIDCHDPDRTDSLEPTIHSVFFYAVLA